MAQVKGIYKFKDTISILPESAYATRVNFSVVNEPEGNVPIPNNRCIGITVKMVGTNKLKPEGFILYYFHEADESYNTLRTVHNFDGNSNSLGWTYENYRTIDFGETPQEVSDEFYAWLLENAVQKKAVKGPYTLKDKLTEGTFESEEVNFYFYDYDSGGSRSGVRIEVRDGYLLYFYNRAINPSNPEITAEYSYVPYTYPNDRNLQVGWLAEGANTIDFGEEPKTVSNEFYAWLMENVAFVIEYPQITINQNGTTTLATAGKYCDRNIEINVVVDEIGTILDGSFSGEYASDKITSLRAGAFFEMKNVTNVSLPNCTVFTGSRHFFLAENLESVYLPNLTTIEDGYYAFGYTSIKELNLPNLTTINGTVNPCYSMTKVEKINLPKLGGTTIGTACFYATKKLVALILGGNTLNPLGATNVFKSSNIESGAGYIYVPDNLVDTYKTATNWSVYAEQIKPISEYKTLITFTINNQPYQTEEGMTWGEWVVSEYNADGYYARESDNRVFSSDNRLVWTLNNSVILANLVIESDAAYKTTGWNPEEG